MRDPQVVAELLASINRCASERIRAPERACIELAREYHETHPALSNRLLRAAYQISRAARELER